MKNNYKIKSHFTSFINKIHEKKVDKPDDLESETGCYRFVVSKEKIK